MSTIRCSIHELEAALGRDAECQVIDVREGAEYEGERIPGTRLVPLSALDHHLDRIDEGRTVYVVCRSGNRATLAAQRLVARKFPDVRVVEGGLVAWMKAGKPVERGTRRTWSLERQVRFTAGMLVVLGLLLGVWVHPALALLSGLVGTGLMFSAATDTCAMGLLLARMPWNRASGAQCGVAE